MEHRDGRAEGMGHITPEIRHQGILKEIADEHSITEDALEKAIRRNERG